MMDFDSENALKEEIKSLTKRKFELESKVHLPQPIKFGEVLEYLPVVKKAHNNVNFQKVQLHNLKTKMHFYELCGIHVADYENRNEIKVCFSAIYTDVEYFCFIENNPGRMEVKKYFLPPIVPIEELTEQYLISKKQFNKFCRKIYHYILVFDDRVNQINIFKNSKESSMFELFHTHSTHIIKIDLKTVDETSKKISITLKYEPDFILPQKIMLSCQDMYEEEKLLMMERSQVFKTMPLLEATKACFHENSEHQ